jgi:hypothetical protein
MSYSFQQGAMYRMPTHFGPATGPRCGPDGKPFDWTRSPHRTTLAVSFLSERGQLDALLPPGFTVGDEPVVTVAMSYLTDLPWLAGRGYNMLGVSFPAVFTGQRDRAAGNFLAVLWENMAEPIMTGREELGYSKIFCELPQARFSADSADCQASWQGFTFLELELSQLQPAPLTIPAVDQLHYKYIPRTGDWGQADVAYAVLTPSHNPNAAVQEVRRGSGSVRFHRPRWEDMPTQHMIVNRLADLDVRQWRGASLVRTIGGKDLSDQRPLL